jgi:ferredoxin
VAGSNAVSRPERGKTLPYVWIDNVECMGAGTCEQIAPDVFVGSDDGTWVVKEDARHFGTTVVFDGGPDGGRARIPHHLVDDVVDAAEMCPAECIYVEA